MNVIKAKDIIEFIQHNTHEESSAASHFNALVSVELKRARGIHPEPFHSLHEGYAVIKEELDEFWDEVKLKEGNRSTANILKELVETAAMCRRTAEDLFDVPSD